MKKFLFPLFFFFMFAHFSFFCFASSVSGNDIDLSSYSIDLSQYEESQSYICNANITVDGDYYLSQDGVMPLGTVTSNSARVIIKSVPAGATVSGNINVFFTGNSILSNLDPGYVYGYVFTPPANPYVSFPTIYFSSDFTLTSRTTAFSNGMVLFDNTNLAYQSSGQGGDIPVLSSSLQVHFVQSVSLPYSITNTSTSVRDADFTIQGSSVGALQMVKKSSLASLYSASAIDYTNLLVAISNSLTSPEGNSIAKDVLLLRHSLGLYGSVDSGDINGKLFHIFNYTYNMDKALGPLSATDAESVNGRLWMIVSRLTNNYSAEYSLFNHLNAIYSGLNSNISQQGFETRSSINVLIGHMNTGFSSVVQALNTQTTGYDSAVGNAQKDKLDQSISDFDSLQDEAFADASSELGNFSFNDLLQYPVQMMRTFEFVGSFVSSFLAASGDFSIVLSSLYVLAFLSIVLGIWRFARK